MIQLTVITVGGLKEAYWRDAVKEYEKRLSTMCKMEILQLEEEPDRPGALAKEADSAGAEGGAPFGESLRERGACGACRRGQADPLCHAAKSLPHSALRGGKAVLLRGAGRETAERDRRAGKPLPCDRLVARACPRGQGGLPASAFGLGPHLPAPDDARFAARGALSLLFHSEGNEIS